MTLSTVNFIGVFEYRYVLHKIWEEKFGGHWSLCLPYTGVHPPNAPFNTQHYFTFVGSVQYVKNQNKNISN